MEEISLSEYIGMLGRRKGTVAAVTVVALIIGALFAAVTPHTFRAKATILFPQHQSSAAAGLLSQLGGLSMMSGAAGGVSSPLMYSEILKSRTLADQVVKNLKLEGQVDPGALSGSVEVDTSKESILKLTCFVPATWVKDAGPDRDRKTSQLAADITNAYIDELGRFDRRHALTSGRHNRVFLEGEVARTRKQLASAEESLRRFVSDHPTVAPPDAASEQYKAIVSLRSAQIQAEADLREADRASTEAKSVVADQDMLESLSKVITDNPVISTLRGQLAQNEIDRAKLLENFTDKHPDVIALDEEIAKTREKMSQEAQKVTSSETFGINPVRLQMVQKMAELQVKRSGLEARVEAMNGVMTGVEQEISKRAGDEMHYVRLARDVKALEMVYTSLLAEMNNAKVSESKDPEGFTLLDAAMPESARVKPKTKMVLVAALILGLWAGSFLAIISESRRLNKRPHLRSPEPVGVGERESF